MSIEVQKAPIISQIVLDKSNNDLQFSLDENGVITNSASKKATSKFNKTNDFLEDNYGSMASKYSDGYDSYDDDFEDDSPARKSSRIRTRDRQQSLISETRSDYSYTPSPPSTKRNKKNTANTSRRNSLVSYRSAYGPSRATNKPKKTKKSQSANSRPSKPDDTPSVVKKILSANRNKITKLYNIVEELQQEVDNLHQENRTLKRINVKQERELKRVDRDEGSLPQLLQRHSAELRTYRERLKKNKQEIVKKERESHSHDTELTKLRDKLHHYKELDSNKKLEERATLAKKLEKVEKSLAERDSKILELQKTIKLTEKARQREIKEQQDRYKKAKDELVKVQENVVSLREKLKEKEKQLDMTNIYHQNIQRKMKKVNPLALPPTYENEISTHATSQKEKRVNVFLTNDVVSDTSSNVTAEPAKVERKSDDYSLEKKKKDSLDKSLELEKLHEIRLKEQFEREEKRKREEEEGRLRREEEDRLRKEEEKKRMEERQRKEEEELKELRRRREEEERKRKEQERLELERKKREEEERIRKEKEEQARLKFQEDEETRRKKDLLLARMKAIDSGQGKPNGIINMDLTTKTIDEKPKKLPIFLQSSEKPKETTTQSKTTDNEKHKFGSSTSIRSKQSKESSHEVKESFENLHHGLPAHPSDQHFRGRRNSLDDDLTFGSYKPTVGRRAESNKKNDTTFGSYNPSFGETRKHSGLDFSSKADKKDNKKNDTTFGSYNPSFGETRKHSGLDFSSKADKKDKSKDIVFGSYEPTLTSSKTNQPKNKENEVGLDFSSKRNEGRRPRANQPNSIFGDDLFNKEKPKKTSIFDDDTFGSSNTSKDKAYPWEKKVSVTAADKDVDSLLPRRPKLNQSFNQGPKQSVPAVGNMLNGTYEDDIEEMTL